MSAKLHPARKKFTRFASKVPFQFGLPNVSPTLTQASDGSPIYFTRTSSLLRRQVLANAPSVTIKSDAYHPRVLPRNAWAEADFRTSRVLFLIPDDALGDCVGMALFFRAFAQKYPKAKIAVLNSASASDIFATLPRIEIFQLFISSKQLARFDVLIDLSEMEGWDTIAKMPVNPEEALSSAFDVTPISLPKRQPVIKPQMNIGILPMASSPLRTLPPALVRDMAQKLGNAGHSVTLILNAYQGVMRTYKDSIAAENLPNVAVVDGFRTIGDLIGFMEKQDYVVLADSGPAHITKLFQTPGLGIYTSASAAVLQGRHRNLRNWQSTYMGDFCQAPCGLAKLRATDDGQIGCMGSLKVPFEKLGTLPATSNKAVAEKLVVESTVPCVAHLRKDQDAIFQILAEDLKTQ
ncbi:glycosyltransferase family 9 protein [Thalassospira lucentensis]|uniref:glycosyltransferase family 9 protein n=1 Tax=Thalassospira lucentensis TaxID=168935 RepID=UPI003AA9C721